MGAYEFMGGSALTLVEPPVAKAQQVEANREYVVLHVAFLWTLSKVCARLVPSLKGQVPFTPGAIPSSPSTSNHIQI